MLIDPWGDILDRKPKGQGIVIGEIDHARIAEVRANLPALKHRVMSSANAFNAEGAEKEPGFAMLFFAISAPPRTLR